MCDASYQKVGGKLSEKQNQNFQCASMISHLLFPTVFTFDTKQVDFNVAILSTLYKKKIIKKLIPWNITLTDSAVKMKITFQTESTLCICDIITVT